jgi:hypothetical protein
MKFTRSLVFLLQVHWAPLQSMQEHMNILLCMKQFSCVSDASIICYWLQYIHILIFSVFCLTYHVTGCEHCLALLDCLSLKLDMSLSSLAVCNYYVMCVEAVPIFLCTLSSPSSGWERWKDNVAWYITLIVEVRVLSASTLKGPLI